MNVLVTGANGFIGSSIINSLSNSSDFTFFKGTRESIDLYSHESVKRYVEENEINSVIHCAIEGGRRNITDSADVFYRNLLMFEKLISQRVKFDRFINFSSGVEYDSKSSIISSSTDSIGTNVPTGYYALSKYIISQRILNKQNPLFVNLRIFGCFGITEREDRFIKTNINNYIQCNPIIIHQDRYMDYIYINDIINIVKFYLTKSVELYTIKLRDVNLTYVFKLKLSDIATMINNLDERKVEIIIQNQNLEKSYTGKSDLCLYNNQIEFTGLEGGIRDCYNKLL